MLRSSLALDCEVASEQYRIYIYIYTHAVDMSERCIHCGASDSSLIQSEYANWVSSYVHIYVAMYIIGCSAAAKYKRIIVAT